MKRDSRLDLIRSVAILMIFTFHFCCTIGNTGIWYGYANGGWGSVGTTMFFVLSGFLLGNKYHGKFSVKDFYLKRWISIFPLFYLTFAVAFLVNGLTTGNWRYGGSVWRIVFTLLGCDNYLSFYGVPTYALVGEWFTAVIVIIYLIYPLLYWLDKKSAVAGSVLVYGLYFLNLAVDWFQVVDDANPITGIAMFWTGMMLARHAGDMENKWLFAPELALTALIVVVKLPGNALLWKNMLGCMVFGMLFLCGGLLEGAPGGARAFAVISKYSYAAYLCHHFILSRGVLWVGAQFHEKFGAAGFYLLCLFVTGVVSALLYESMEFLKRNVGVLIGRGSH